MKNSLKKISLALALALLATVSLTACKDNNAELPDDSANVNDNVQNPVGNENGEDATDPDDAANADNNGDEENSDNTGDEGNVGSEEESEKSPLSDTMAAILKDVEELPAYMELPLDSENFSFFTFTDYIEGAVGLASDALNSSLPHSVVLVQLPEGTDVDAYAKTMEENADPRKWICVEAEKTIVSKNGNMVLLVMTREDTADAITANFLALE